MGKSLVKTVVVSMIGNLFEWFDFALFGYFAPIIGKLFFPSDDPTTELISAFGVFAAGFLARPLGGIIFGHIGDRLGRKKALVMTIILMAAPTAIIGCLPTYAQIGIAAPILLIIMRMLQGLSMGGNYSGSITFTTEHTNPKYRGFIGSFAVASCLGGILLGSATAAILSFILPESDLYTWGWRVPFIIGILICLVGYYMRRNIPESPEYILTQETGKIQQHPVIEVFREHGRTLVRVVLIIMLHDLSFYILFVYMASYLSEIIGLSKNAALTINTINLIVVSFMTIVSAWLSDRFGRKPVLTVAALMFIVGTIPLLTIVSHTTDTTTILIAQMALAVAVGGYFGPLPALMVESYPSSIRFSAIAITTNISGPLFGGTAPILVAYFVNSTGSSLIPAYYLTVGAIISLIALCFMKPVLKPEIDLSLISN